MLIYNGQIIAGGGTIVLPMTRAEYEANKAILDSADVWVDLTDEPDQIATADQIAYSVDGVQKGMNYIGDIATKAVAKVEPTDRALNGTITLGTNCHVLPKGVANDINSKLSKNWNLSSTRVALNAYSYSTPYIAPHDGFAVCVCDFRDATGTITLYALESNSNSRTIYINNCNGNNIANTIFIKKGMKIFAELTSVNYSGIAYQA